MTTHPPLPSRNLIGWLSGRIAPSCPLDSAAKQNWKRTLTKLSQNSRKTSESYKTRERTFDKTRERFFFGNSQWIFRTNFGKLENQQKTLGKWFWTNFVKNNFSENCLQILGECSEYFRFCHLINNLLTGFLVPYREILSLVFQASSVRTPKPRT